MKNVYITGGTGHLGLSMVYRILQTDGTVILLVRPGSLEKFGGARSLFQSIKDLGLRQSIDWIARRVRFVAGDITKPLMGLDQAEHQRLAKEVTNIYHSAAQLDFTASRESLWAANVMGTKNVLDFGMFCAEQAHFEGLNHISTFAVAGTLTGTFYETDLDCGQKFNNGYEKSKFEAEKLIAEYRAKGLLVSIFRPSIVVGHSKTGETRSFETLYKPLHFLSLGLFDEIPANGRTRLNLVPVDSAAAAITTIIERNNTKNLTYHIVNETEIDCNFLVRVAGKHLGFTEPLLIPTEEFDHATLNGFRRKMLDPYIPYLNRKRIIWDTKNVRGALKDTSFSWPKVDEEFLERLFNFCLRAGYIRKPGSKSPPLAAKSVISGLDM